MNDFYERNGLPDPETAKQVRLTRVLREWHEGEITEGGCRERLDACGLSPNEVTSFMRMERELACPGVEFKEGGSRK